MQKSFSLLDSFASISGLRINYEKTETLWIGAMHFQRRKIAAYQNISPSHKVKALGVWLSTIKEESITLNYEENKETISKTIKNRQFRRLTLLEKIVVIKSLLASQLIYIMSLLPTSSGHLKYLNNLLYQFLWDGKRDKIKLVEMINDYATGGLKRECPGRPREITKMWHMLEKLISLIFCSEIPHDELINVVYLFSSDLLLFSKKIGKIVHDANRHKMVDIKGPSINTRTSLLKSAKASSLFFFWCIYMGGIGKLFKRKSGIFI